MSQVSDQNLRAQQLIGGSGFCLANPKQDSLSKQTALQAPHATQQDRITPQHLAMVSKIELAMAIVSSHKVSCGKPDHADKQADRVWPTKSGQPS